MLRGKFTYAASLAVGLVVAAAGSAQAGPAINVNVFDGGGTSLATNVETFDWQSNGSGLAIGVGPFGSALAVGDTFQFLYQAVLAQYTFGAGGGIPGGAPALNANTNGGVIGAGTYQFTVAASFTERVIATTANSATFDILPGGSISIFYDGVGGSIADRATGTGFTDGTEVARFTIQDGVTQFTILGGGGSGIGTPVTSEIQAATDLADPAFIEGILFDIFDFHTDAPIQFPPGTGATTGFFTGSVHPLYTPTAVTGDDINFRVDGSSSFTRAPEPASLALLGTGLLALGAFARRRRKQTA